MSPELIAILTIGVSLAGGQLATVLWVAGRFERVANEMADLREHVGEEMADLRERIGSEMADRFERVGKEMADLRERLARLEGLLDGLREAISGRRETV